MVPVMSAQNDSKFNLILVDGSSYLFRAYHALPPLTNKQGHPTGAIKGVISMIKRLVEGFPAAQVVVVFDAKGKTFRNDLYADYKAHRPPMPEDLRVQIEPIHNMIRAMGLPLLSIEGIEADDVIGTLAARGRDTGQHVLISTGDKDMAQLVNDHITLMNTMTDERLDEAGVVDKFGVRPDQIIDYLALVGDTVDNIPGVPKCGPKTAVKWLDQYGSLEGVVAAADEIKGKVGENLRGALTLLPLSYDLATIRCELGLEIVPEIPEGIEDLEALRALFETFEFKSWIEEIGVSAAPPQPQVEAAYETVLTQAQLERWLDQLQQAERFAFDTETTSLDYMSAELVGLSLCIAPGQAAYVPFNHDYEGAPEQLDQRVVLEAIAPYLNDPNKCVIGQHLKYDINVLARYGVSITSPIHDTMLLSYVLNSVVTRHNMDDLAQFYLGYKTTKFEEIAGKGVKQKTFNEIELEAASHYAAEDADITLRLFDVLWAMIEAEPSLHHVYMTIERPLVQILSTMERHGVMLDVDRLNEQSAEIGSSLERLEKEAHSLAGEVFNLGSPKQLQHIFFEKLGLPVLKKTPKGQPSTNEAVLQELALDYPLPHVILRHRSLSKLKSTYTDQLPKQVRPDTGRLHTSYHQAVAATGRLSSTDPNLQNIPIRTEEGRRVRKAFITAPGSILVAADYSQIELRIMAHLSKDEGLLRAFNEGLDVHRATASEVFGTTPDAVTTDQRRSAKAINFGLIYGMSAFGLSRQLNIPRQDAQDYIDLYFERYPGVRSYMDDTRAQAAAQGYVETLFGRRLYLPDIKAGNFQLRQAAERTAINAPMQGSAADIIKLAMRSVQAWLEESSLATRMIMQVHDELVFEVPEAEIEPAVTHIQSLMSSAAQLLIPLEVEVGQGVNWEEAH